MNKQFKTVGVDTGKDATKYVWEEGQGIFSSKICPYRELVLESKNQDFVIEFKGKKYFGGDLAEREGHIQINYKDTSKLHETSLINLLTALHQIPGSGFKIVIGSPISCRTAVEKEALIKMVLGSHKITINGESKAIEILDSKISPEGAAASFYQPMDGVVQGLDFGSTTINYYVMADGEFINKRSGTFAFDTEIKDYTGVMEGIAAQLSNKFEKDNPTMLIGGLAEKFLPEAKKYYLKSFLSADPIMATAYGFYEIAREVYGDD